MNINTLTTDEFKALPLVIEGESKEVRYLGKGLVVIRFKPTIYSFTHNRCEVVEGSHIPRLEATKVFVNILKAAGIRHAYREVGKEFILADLVMPHKAEFEKYGLKEFIPSDLSKKEIAALPKAPPIEVIAKRYLTGTTKHSCIGMAGSLVRSSHPFYSEMKLEGDGALPEMLIRFDWRNPLIHPEKGTKIADTVLPTQLADLFIDVKKAQRTAFLAAKTIEEFLATKNIVFYDLCMFIDESGTMMYGEVSPDCGRYRHLDLGSLDKDVWRAGGSSQDVIKKWKLLVELLTSEAK